MNIPTLNAGAMIGKGVNAAPFSVDLGVRIKREENRSITADECMALFGDEEAVLMNFIPQMMTGLAMEYVEQLCDYCGKEKKISTFKKHIRQLRICLREFDKEMRYWFKRAYFTYEHYYARYHAAVEADLFKCWCAFTNESARQFVGYRLKEVPAYLAFTRMLLTFVEDFNRNVDKVIEDKTGIRCNARQSIQSDLASAIIVDMAECFGNKMEITEPMERSIKVLANKCRAEAIAIVREENGETNVNKR